MKEDAVVYAVACGIGLCGTDLAKGARKKCKNTIMRRFDHNKTVTVL